MSTPTIDDILEREAGRIHLRFDEIRVYPETAWRGMTVELCLQGKAYWQLERPSGRAPDSFLCITDVSGRALLWPGDRAKVQEVHIPQPIAAMPSKVEEELRAEVQRLRARIDALQLEYEPDAMSPEQVAEWAAHQREVAEPSPSPSPSQQFRHRVRGAMKALMGTPK
jgi:hypothetical protein